MLETPNWKSDVWYLFLVQQVDYDPLRELFASGLRVRARWGPAEYSTQDAVAPVQNQDVFTDGLYGHVSHVWGSGTGQLIACMT